VMIPRRFQKQATPAPRVASPSLAEKASKEAQYTPQFIRLQISRGLSNGRFGMDSLELHQPKLTLTAWQNSLSIGIPHQPGKSL
jgi:hypothetical protein